MSDVWVLHLLHLVLLPLFVLRIPPLKERTSFRHNLGMMQARSGFYLSRSAITSSTAVPWKALDTQMALSPPYVRLLLLLLFSFFLFPYRRGRSRLRCLPQSSCRFCCASIAFLRAQGLDNRSQT
ncbi:hypothetical protein B0T13DRAFT_118370 [Neurospora crassa]|nr:hypothetical protein B0T13DRAFT_118370 [Neurospora crassa]